MAKINMKNNSDIFDLHSVQKDSNTEIHVLYIKDYTTELRLFLDDCFVSICEGNSGTDLQIVKKSVNKYLERQSDETRMGAIAEFFIHLFLKSIGYKQECFFRNLEENSIKKGFDGYYSKGGSEWIMESKSSSDPDVSHKDKIAEAYHGLKNKLAGKDRNNPWRNAYNHASHRDLNTNKSIIKNIKKLSDNFEKEEYTEIKNYNVIPASTIFLNEKRVKPIKEGIAANVNKRISKYGYVNISAVCITQKSLKYFLDYING